MLDLTACRNQRLCFWIVVYCAAGQDSNASDIGEDVGEDVVSDSHASLALDALHYEVDHNKDGAVSKEELLKFVEKQHEGMKLEQNDPAAMLESFDASKDGLVSLEEYLHDITSVENSDFVCEDSSCEEKLRHHRDSVKKRVSDETELFTAADANHDGVLDLREMSSLAAPREDGIVFNTVLKQSMAKADVSGDNKLNEEEFNYAYAQLDNTGGAPMQFSELDGNGDGFVDQDELRGLSSGKRARMVENMVQDLDVTGDKHITADELLQGKDQMLDSELQTYLINWAEKRKIQKPTVIV